ncbi:hypothetical protein BJV74DRAFT_865409, partial [Russula compacta]
MCVQSMGHTERVTVCDGEADGVYNKEDVVRWTGGRYGIWTSKVRRAACALLL